MDEFAASSHAKGAAAISAGLFDEEIVALMGRNHKTGEVRRVSESQRNMAPL